MHYPGLLETFREYLPVSDHTPLLTLYEGNTPLIFAEHLSHKLKLQVYLKYEGLNPTGSFKDRGMVLAVAKAIEEKSRTVICASTGNTSAAAAAYAAKSGLNCIVLIPSNKVAMGKLAQTMMYGAKIISIDGNFDRALDIVKELSQNTALTLVNSLNPYRIEGQKTGAFEICEQLGEVPDYVSLPVGNAGNITAYWKGFQQFYDLKKISSRPKMLGFEAEGAMAIVKGSPILSPETIATAIRIGNPASWEGATQAAQQSGGQINYVTDQEILEAYRLIAKTEGIFVEPASAASLAGIIKLTKQEDLKQGAKVVCILTGHGLKDPEISFNSSNVSPISVPSEVKKVREAIERLEKE